MAALLGAARLLAARREQLAGNVLFLFQPAEEAATGAMQVLEQGLFRRVPMAGMLALHVWPGLAQGQLGVRSGAILSAVDSFEITVTGRGGHGSAPERACNPIPAGAALASALTTLRANDLPQAEPAVTAVTCIQAGTCNNVIPDRCILLGTIRTFSARTRAQAKARLEALTAGIAAAWGCTASSRLDGRNARPMQRCRACSGNGARRRLRVRQKRLRADRAADDLRGLRLLWKRGPDLLRPCSASAARWACTAPRSVRTPPFCSPPPAFLRKAHGACWRTPVLKHALFSIIAKYDHFRNSYSRIKPERKILPVIAGRISVLLY